MHYVIHCLDHADAAPRRLAHYDDHKAYLSKPSVAIVISGPLLSDDGEHMIGSLFIVEADSLDKVHAFNAADPFTAANVWREVRVHPFHKRMDNRG
jgi:uncharacterized protein YciI